MRLVGSLSSRDRMVGAWLRARTAALLCALPLVAAFAVPVGSAPSDDRKQPMRFVWHAPSEQAAARGAADCEPLCAGFISAVGTVTGDTPQAFEALAGSHDLRGATIVLNSGGGSVLDTLTLGRRWRELGVVTTVGAAVTLRDGGAARLAVRPDAACESMCAFLLLAGTTRSVPKGARVRVHQIWMGDRADNAQAASYSAQDMTIVQRDVGRLAQYTFEMGGSGTLLSLALSVPPWEPLHELSRDELIAANLVTMDGAQPLVAATGKPAKLVQDRIAVSTARHASEAGHSSSRTAEAGTATGGIAAPTDSESPARQH